ncbi:TonB family protein [Halomonas binhaiensis]|uniref:Protein TonB n=1 Tax=Halomonas binhaiensis TaxID=2562282 RepID=A0A5C1NDN2_9GAMM|nr:TonB family protein [Halomonas binhaiensis]QEM81396.1 TonB family protein [Halomonas binhaiensis]
MRRVVSLILGAGIAFGLFVALALLVVPPEAEPELREEITVELTDAPAPESEQPVEAASASVPPPPPVAATPPPPAPAPNVDSNVQLPDPEVPALDAPAPQLDSALPELVETPPPPKPQPKPQPQPEPTPQPVATPAPSPAPVPSSVPSSAPAATSASAPSAAAPASNEPVAIGESAVVSMTKPTYPNRARRRGIEGYASVDIIVRPDGSVDTGRSRIVDVEPRGVFEREVEKVMPTWRFTPGQGVRRFTKTFKFEMKE